jgi:hypothetical protein
LARRLSCDIHENKPLVSFHPAMLLITKVVNTFSAFCDALEQHGTVCNLPRFGRDNERGGGLWPGMCGAKVPR